MPQFERSEADRLENVLQRHRVDDVDHMVEALLHGFQTAVQLVRAEYAAQLSDALPNIDNALIPVLGPVKGGGTGSTCSWNCLTTVSWS